MLHVPYVGSVGRPITAGVVVKISGLSPINAQRFNVNLQCGPSINPRDDVAFHMSADFYNQCLVSNNILENKWGLQQCDSFFPFNRGEEFIIDVSCKRSSFEVAVNAQYSVSFEHRIDPSRITHLAIDGDVVLYNVEYIGGLHSAISDSFIPGIQGAVPGLSPIGFQAPPLNTPSQSPTYNSPFPLYSVPDPSRLQSQPNFQSPYIVQEPYPNPYNPSTQYPAPNSPPVFPQPPAYSALTQHQFTPAPHSQSLNHPKFPAAPQRQQTFSYNAVSGEAKKPSKFSQKTREKARKFGLPVAAGTGLGAYAMKGWFRKGSKSSEDSD